MIQALAAAPQRARVRELELGLQTQMPGEFGDLEPLCGWGDLSALWAQVPTLARLKLRGQGGTLGELSLPELRHFTLETWAFEDDEVTAILEASWPKLERLELWDPQGAIEVARLLERCSRRPLVHLALLRRPGLDAVLSDLSTSPLLPRLRVVDLRDGVLTDFAVDLLTRQREAFAHLRLNLTGSAAEGQRDRLARLPFVVLDEPADYDEFHEPPSDEPHPDDSGEWEAEAWEDPAGDGPPPSPLADLDIPDENGEDR